jgi:hypothetical protein
VLKNEIEKKITKKKNSDQPKLTKINHKPLILTQPRIEWCNWKKKLIRKRVKKLKSIELTCQTCSLGHGIEITSWKIILKKLWIPILNKPNVEEWKKD